MRRAMVSSFELVFGASIQKFLDSVGQTTTGIQCTINVTNTNEAQTNEIKRLELWKLRCAKNSHQSQNEAVVASRR